MTTVIKNATIVTGDNGRTVLYDSAIAIDGDRIVAIGPTPEVTAAHPADEQIEGSGKALFPGLVNCHTHLLASNDRGILEDWGFPTTLKFPASARSLLSQEERQVMATLGVLEAIRSGTTCLLEVQAEVADYAEYLEKTGMRMVLADSVNDVDESAGPSGSSSARMDQGLQRCADLIDTWHGKGDGRISCFVAPHAPETVSPGLLRRSREMAESYDVGYTIHLSQSPNEIESVMRVRGVPPTHYLFANDFLGPRLVLAHCRYVNSAEVALLVKRGVACPTTPPSPPGGERPLLSRSLWRRDAAWAWARTTWPRTWWRSCEPVCSWNAYAATTRWTPNRKTSWSGPAMAGLRF